MGCRLDGLVAVAGHRDLYAIWALMYMAGSWSVHHNLLGLLQTLQVLLTPAMSRQVTSVHTCVTSSL